MVAPRGWVPDRGDLIWVEFTPQAGHEQAGRRPALVVSPRAYNAAAGLALLCPVTSRVKGYAFEVALPDGGSVKGVVLADQIKSQDWRARRVHHIGSVTGTVMEEVRAKLRTLVE